MLNFTQLSQDIQLEPDTKPFFHFVIQTASEDAAT